MRAVEWPETGSCRRLGWGRARADQSGPQTQGYLGSTAFMGGSLHGDES